MRVELVRLGNSRGIRIPRPIIEQCGFGDTVELSVDKNRVIIAPDRLPRQGWDEVFRAAGSGQTDEVPLADLPPNEFDSQEWEW